MKTGKKYYEKQAKMLYTKSLTSGDIDEKKTRSNLLEIIQQKPAGLSSILKIYKRLITNKIAQEQIVIETGSQVPLQKSTIDLIKSRSGAKKVTCRVNPQIVFGTKISHGDWLWDNTLEAKLKQVTAGK